VRSIPAYDPVAIRFFWFSNLHLILCGMFGFLEFSFFLSCLSTQIQFCRDAWWYKIDSYTWFAGSFAFAKHFLRTKVHFPKKFITCVLVLYSTNYFIPIEHCCYNISSKVIRILQIDLLSNEHLGESRNTNWTINLTFSVCLKTHLVPCSRFFS